MGRWDLIEIRFLLRSTSRLWSWCFLVIFFPSERGAMKARVVCHAASGLFGIPDSNGFLELISLLRTVVSFAGCFSQSWT